MSVVYEIREFKVSVLEYNTGWPLPRHDTES